MQFAHLIRNRLSAGLFLFLAAGCGDAALTEPEGEEGAGEEVPVLLEQEREQGPPLLSQSRNSAPSIAYCGENASYRLWAGLWFPGTIEVGNDSKNLYVTYRIKDDEEEWFITDTRLSITRSVVEIPLDDRRLPNPWAFEHGAVHAPATKSYTYSIPLASENLRPGEKVFVAAMAGLVRPVTNDWNGAWKWMVGWGLGNFTGRTLEDLANYTVQGCSEPIPDPIPGGSPALTITFDDGWETTYTNALPVLEEFGLKANIAINPTPIDENWVGYMDLEQVTGLHDRGWAVVAHGMTHKALPSMSEPELRNELESTRAWIDDKGFRGSHIFVVPFHDWGDRERSIIPEYYRAARGYTANQFFPPRMVPHPVSEADRFQLTAYEPEFAPFTSAAGRALTREYIELAVSEKKFLELFFHKIEDEDVPEFRELMRMVAEYSTHVRTYDEIIP